jgi:murein DD-endopeptidase MepM/ murein hydrolase activator NlpD
MLAFLAFVAIGHFSRPVAAATLEKNQAAQAEPTALAPVSAIPPYLGPAFDRPIERSANVHTERDPNIRLAPVQYTVESGDSIFGIAESFNISPETLLWANYDTLYDDPHMIFVGTQLIVPPADGILYKWKSGDTIEAVANRYRAFPKDVLTYPGNNLDVANPTPEIAPGTYVMIPGGWRETKPWVVPSIPRGRAGVNPSIPGACSTGEGGAIGTGYFIWPSVEHYISGNRYWSGHLAIDIGVGLGDSIFAADSGVVVYAGWISGGYGNMIMIDHGNGYQTLYAHLSAINVQCGQSVYRGQTIGYGGSTGNSTGPHLHFEVRYFGGFLNPLDVLH